MTGTAPGGYAPVESFETGRVTAVSADDSRVVLGTETGHVEIVAADGRTTVEFDAPITDLAAGNRVYALADGTVSALSTGGTRVWSVELPAARKLAALPGPDVLGVVTDDDALVGFDGETGGQEFEVERPHADVTDDPGFFGTEGAFVLVAWSFLAVRNLDGTERFDLNLDGAIESAGIVEDTVVVSLKNERVVGVHAKTGEKQWERELAVTDLPDRGDDALLFTAGDQLVSLTADGTYSTVEDLPGGEVYPTSDATLFCAITDDTVGVYCAGGDPGESLSVSVADDELVPGVTESVVLDVRNDGDRPVEADLRAEGEGVELAETQFAVDLAPGESATRALSVGRIEADDAASIAVEADGVHLASVSLSVDGGSDGSLVAEAELDGVTDGVASFAVEVRNDGDGPLTGVSVSPGDVHVGRLAPGESATATVETGLDPGTPLPVLARSDDAEADLDATVPRDAFAVDVTTSPEGFVDVRVENRSGAELSDDLVVAGNCFDARLERRVDLLGGETLVLALRPDVVPDAVSVEASLAGLDVGQSAQFPPDSFDAAGGGASGHGGREASERAGRGRGASGRGGPGREASGRDSSGREASGRQDGATDRRTRTGTADSSRERPRGDRQRDGREAHRESRDRPRESHANPREARDRPPQSGDRCERPRDQRHQPRERDRQSRERDQRSQDRPRRPRDQDGDRDRRPRESERESRDAERESRDAERESRNGGQRPQDGDRSDQSGGRPRQSRTADPAKRDTAAGVDRVSTGAVLAAERSVEPADPARTAAVRESVAVTNEGDATAEEVMVEFPGGSAAVGSLPPGDRATVTRQHAFVETGEVTLPAGTVTAANADETRVEARTLDVTAGTVEAEFVVEPDDGDPRVRATLTNNAGDECEVDRIGAKQFGVWDPDLRVAPGETVEWTQSVEAAELPDGVVDAAVEYALDGGETDRLDTLGRVGEASEAEAGIDALAATVGEETRISDGYGSVVLVVENRGESPVADVSVEATGEAVSDLMYGGSESVAELAPGDRFTHFVDVETDGPEATVSVDLSAGDSEAELTLDGPAPGDEDDWSEETLAEWSVEREDGGDDADAPALVTEFERA